jgi:pilus assembly protein CpaF
MIMFGDVYEKHEKLEPLVLSLREQVLSRLGHQEEMSDEGVSEIIDACIREQAQHTYISIQERSALRQYIFDSIRRLDILSGCLDDEEITEIMINGPEQIFVERRGVLERYPKHFLQPQLLDNLIQQIVSGVNRQVNEANPIVDARLPDGSRVNIVLKPIALDGPVMTIRKFSKQRMSMERLVEGGSISREAAEYLRTLVEARYNIFISGGTGSGKTTLLNCLSEYIDPHQRVITIEDSAELQLQNIENLVRLETRGEGTEGTKPVTIRDLIRSALRMRPDRLIVGAVRGAEALDMLQAMNTGHDGSLSTGHANSPGDMLRRLETMVLMGHDGLPLAAIRGQISSAIDILVQIGRLRDGSRRVLSIDEVEPMENGEIPLHTLFRFEEEGEVDGTVQGRLCFTGEALHFKEKLVRAGKVLPQGEISVD